MPSFDVVSEVDLQEASNAVDQANREVGTRYDFKGVEAKYERSDNAITMTAEGEFQLKQMLDILNTKLHKRGVDISCIDLEKPEKSGMKVKQKAILRQGIDKEIAKKVVKLIKDKKMKVQAAIQGEQVRVTGKKRDDLQAVMAMLKEAKLGLPLQYTNFRD